VNSTEKPTNINGEKNMSLEQVLKEVADNVKELTAVITKFGGQLNLGSTAAPAATEAKTETKSTKGKGKAAPAKETPVSDGIVDLDHLDDTGAPSTELDDDLGLGFDEEPVEEAVKPEVVQAKLGELAKKKGRDAAIGLMKKFKAANFQSISASDLPKIYKEAVALLA
jgi:hypothetical protein